MTGMEIRTHLCEVRAAPGEGGLRFEGYAAKFDTWSPDLGGFREKIAPGAFARAIIEDDVRCLVNHNPDRVLGRTVSGTTTLREDAVGLFFETDAPDVSWVRDLRASMQRGDINQCSFAFIPVRQEWSYGTGPGGIDERTLLEARLMDVSIVTYPAYPDTIASARSARDVLAQARRERIHPNEIRRKRLNIKIKEIGGI